MLQAIITRLFICISEMRYEYADIWNIRRIHVKWNLDEIVDLKFDFVT